MRKIFKYTSAVSMWLAVAALWLHMIIPHDHHIMGTFSDPEQNCPVSNHQSDHKTGFPVHCHAFNDLASEKARSYQISHNIQNTVIALVSLRDNIVSEPSEYFSGIYDFRTPFPGLYSSEDNHLRAPPSLA
jgi:hypothetical protein